MNVYTPKQRGKLLQRAEEMRQETPRMSYRKIAKQLKVGYETLRSWRKKAHGVPPVFRYQRKVTQTQECEVPFNRRDSSECKKMFVKAVKNFLNDAGMNVDDFRRALNIRLGTLAKWLNGSYLPSLEVVYAINDLANAIGVLFWPFGDRASFYPPLWLSF